MSAGDAPGRGRAPRLARALLRACVPAERVEDVVGDLNEVHARRRARSGALRAWVATSAEAAVVAAGFVVERVRDGGVRTVWLTWPEVKLALRMARKQPLLNLAAVLALATGIGLSAAAFHLARMTLGSELPFPDGDRFVVVRAETVEGAAPSGIEADRFLALVPERGAFAYVGAIGDGSGNLLDEDGAVEAVPGIAMSADGFAVLPYRALVGRTLLPSDGAPGAPPVVVLGEDLWRRRYGGDPAVVGRTVNLAGTVRQVVGVLPAEAGFPNRPDVWTPLVIGGAAEPGAGAGDTRVTVFGVLREGVTAEGAEARLAALSRGWEEGHPGAERLRVRVRPFTELPSRGVVQVFLAALFTAVLAVALVIAANVGNLVAARTAARRGELAVRSALGAARRNLVLQLFGEVLLLGVVAAALAAWGLWRLMASVTVMAGRDIPFWFDFMPDASTWVFVAAVTLLASVVAGGLPALRATRGAPGAGLSASAGGRGGHAVFGRAAAALSVLQVALSVALLGGALLSVRGMALYAGAQPSLASERLLAAGLSLVRPHGPDSARAALERVERAVAEIPGVERAAFAGFVPGVEAPVVMVEVEPAPGEETAGPRPAPVAPVRPGYFETLGAQAVGGRTLESADLLDGAQAVAVVNESFVRKFLQGRNALGRRVRVVEAPSRPGGAAPEAAWREIVGVVPDLGLSVGDPEMEAGLYVPLVDPDWGYLVLSVSDEPGAVADRVRRALARAEPDLLVPLVRPLAQAGSENAKALAIFGGLLSALGGMALLLSLVSTYALVSFTVSRRVREVGIRVALGASRGAVLRAVAGRATLHVAVGAALGAPLGLLLVQTQRLFVFRVPSGEPWLLPLVALVMIAAGALASWVPARRALGVGAAEALRAE